MADPVTAVLINAAISYAISYVLAPDGPDVEGPRLADRGIQTNSYGADMNVVYGTMVVAGTLIWLENNELKETRHKEDTGGKGGGGGGTVTTFTYSFTGAIAIAEGPIGGIARRWADAVLIDSGVTTTSTLTDEQLAQLQLANSLVSNATYLGTETQGQDPRIVASLGAAETPAYRGTAVDVKIDFELENYGRRIPNYQYEVIGTGTEQPFRKVIDFSTGLLAAGFEDTGGIHYANGVLYSGVYNSGSFEYTRATNTGTIIDTQSIVATALPGSAGEGTSATSGLFAYNSGRYSFAIFATSPQYASFFKDGVPLSGAATGVGVEGVFSIPTPTSSNQFAVGDDFIYLLDDVSDGDFAGVFLFAYDKDTGAPSGLFQLFLEDLGFTSAATSMVRYDDANKTLYLVNYDTAPDTMDVYSIDETTSDTLLTWTGLTSKGQVGGDIRGGLFWYSDLDDAASPSYNRTFLIQLNDDQTFTELQTHDGQSAVDSGAETDTTGARARWISDTVIHNGDAIWAYSQTDGDVTTLQSVVEDICARSGMAATDYDASGLAGTNINGYKTRGIASLREKLEPLMQAYRFEPYEDDYKLKFAFRTTDTVVVVTEDDFRPHAYGTDGGEMVQIEQIEESKLPRRININYVNINADYEPDTQFFERNTGASQHIANLTFELALTPTFAVQLADKLLHEAWISRHTYTFSLPKKYAYLAPTNIIYLLTQSYGVEVRLIEVGMGVDGRIQCRAVQHSEREPGTDDAVTADDLAYCPTCYHDALVAMDVGGIWVFDDAPGPSTINNSMPGSSLGDLNIQLGTSYTGPPSAPTYEAESFLDDNRTSVQMAGPPATGVQWFNVTEADIVAYLGYATVFTIGFAVQRDGAVPSGTFLDWYMTGDNLLDNHFNINADGSLTIRMRENTGPDSYFTSSPGLITDDGQTYNIILSFAHNLVNTVYINFQPVWTPTVIVSMPADRGQPQFFSFNRGHYGRFQYAWVYSGYATAVQVAALELGWDRNFESYTPISSPYTSTATTEEPEPGQQVTIAPATTVFYEVIDTNLLLASHNNLPVYFAGTSTNFTGFQMQKSLDSGATWSNIGPFQPNEGTIGLVQNVLGEQHAHFTGRFDPLDSLTVRFLTETPSLASVTDLQAINGSNAFAVGAPGRWEIISAATITQVDAQTFTLSRLLRGMRGTEAHIGSMVIYDAIVKLDTTSVGILPFTSDDIGTTVKLRAVYGAGFPDDDDDTSLTITGNPYKEYAPAQIMGYWQSSGDIELSWNRRARRNGAWRDSVDVPLDALSTPESYNIKIYDNTTSPVTLVRTVAANASNSYTYTAANIATDFGSPLPVAGGILLRVYQVDTIVGESRYGEKVI